MMLCRHKRIAEIKVTEFFRMQNGGRFNLPEYTIFECEDCEEQLPYKEFIKKLRFKEVNNPLK